MTTGKTNNDNLDVEKLEKIKTSLTKLENKEAKFLFCVPDVKNPSASVYEIYFHGNVIKKMGYDVLMLNENDENLIPDLIDNELTSLEHLPLSSNKLPVSPQDFMIIPEVFSNVMEQTKDLPCTRIGLLQSIDYMLNSLIPGTDWKTFNLSDIITTSKSMKDLVNYHYSNKFNIKVYNPGIPSYFKRTDEPKKPIVSIVARNSNDISKIIKLFYSKFPQYSWVTFDPMLTRSKPPQLMRRVDFAKRLGENFAAVWIDRISSWGTFPLECMKSGTIPICFKPDMLPDYILNRDEKDNPVSVKENVGIWTDDFYKIPSLIADTLIRFLDDNIDSKIYDEMTEASSQFTQEKAEEDLTKIYQEYIDTKINKFKSVIK